MKTREETARFIERQMHWSHKCKFEKGSRAHYGWQELKELMDFIYGGEPNDAEALKPIAGNVTPNVK